MAVSSIEGNVRYVKHQISKELWQEARSLALKKGQTIIQWMEEAIKNQIKRESK